MSPTKIAGALVVAGALAIGLAACGSGSGSSQSGSSVKRGFYASRGTYLKVTTTDLGLARLGITNTDSMTVTICAVNVTCKAPVTLSRGQSVDMAAGRVNGNIRYPNGYTFNFEAFNPAVGEPWVAVSDPQNNTLYCQGGSGNIYEPQSNPTRCELQLSENQRRNVDAPAARGGSPGYVLHAYRDADSSDYKMMRLETDPCYVVFGASAPSPRRGSTSACTSN